MSKIQNDALLLGINNNLQFVLFEEDEIDIQSLKIADKNSYTLIVDTLVLQNFSSLLKS